MLAIYAIILTICIAIYALIKTFQIDPSLASNLLVWSATLFAPIAFLYGLRYWKIQNKYEQKLKRLIKLKDIYIKFYILIDNFRRKTKALDLIGNGNNEIYKEKLLKFKSRFEKLQVEFFFYLNKGEEFFDEDELDSLNNKISECYEIVVAFDNSHKILETCILNISNHGLYKGYKLELEKNVYLLDPTCTQLKNILKNLEDKKSLESFEEVILKPLNELGAKLSTLIKRTYE